MKNLIKLISGNKKKDVEGYEILQVHIQKKLDYLKKMNEILQEVNYNIEEYIKKFNSLFCKMKDLKCNEESNSLEVIKLILSQKKQFLESYQPKIETIKLIFGQHINVLKREKERYEEFKKAFMKMKDEKNNSSKMKDLFHKNMKEAENTIKKFFKTNKSNKKNSQVISENEINNLVSKSKKSLQEYKESVNKVNTYISDYNSKQKGLNSYFLELLKKDKEFIDDITGASNLDDLRDNLIRNSSLIQNNFENKSKIKDLIEDIEANQIDEQYINFQKYQSELDFMNCKDENEFTIFINSAKLINQRIDESLFPKLDPEAEHKNYEISKLVHKIFDSKEDVDENTGNELLERLKDESIHKSVFTLLSNLRTNSRFKKNKSIIELIGKVFEYLLDHPAEKQLFSYAKNCMILAQTYYYMNENNQKVYLIEYLKNNNHLTDPKFWKKFMKTMINEEVVKFNRPENIDGKKNTQINEKLNEIVFSQMIPYVSNMLEFNMDKKLILKITDELCEEFNYLNETNLDIIHNLISKDKEEINKLREDYIKEYGEEKIWEETKENEEQNGEKEVKNKEEIIKNMINNDDDDF